MDSDRTLNRGRLCCRRPAANCCSLRERPYWKKVSEADRDAWSTRISVGKLDLIVWHALNIWGELAVGICTKYSTRSCGLCGEGIDTGAGLSPSIVGFCYCHVTNVPCVSPDPYDLSAGSFGVKGLRLTALCTGSHVPWNLTMLPWRQRQ
jgi:hypothetical protein